jgi:hypothetical protein
VTRISATALDFRREFAGEPDLRHQVRRLRWFKNSIRRDAELIAEHHEVELAIDDRRLTETFLNWIEAFNRQKRYASLDRRDFSVFAAGLLLREFMKSRPVSAKPREAARAKSEASIVSFWPEGFLYTNFCLSVLSAVVRQEFGESLSLSEGADDLRVWWSYRENVEEEPSMAIAFLDKFLGEEPNWRVPESPQSRTAMRRATQAG